VGYINLITSEYYPCFYSWTAVLCKCYLYLAPQSVSLVTFLMTLYIITVPVSSSSHPQNLGSC